MIPNTFFYFINTKDTYFNNTFKPQFSHLFKQHFLNTVTKQALSMWWQILVQLDLLKDWVICKYEFKTLSQLTFTPRKLVAGFFHLVEMVLTLGIKINSLQSRYFCKTFFFFCITKEIHALGAALSCSHLNKQCIPDRHPVSALKIKTM